MFTLTVEEEMRKLFAIAAIMLLAAPVALAATAVYDWENGATVLTIFPAGEMICTSVTAPDPVMNGIYSLKCEDADPSGTPDAYVAWVDGLVEGQVVTAGFWVYDDSAGVSPSGRIWAKYTAPGGDVDSYAGSAGGNSAYSAGTGWEYLSWSWTFDDGAVPPDPPTRGGLAIAVRTYSNPGDTVWLDHFDISYPDGAILHLPEPASPVESASWTNIKALYR
jgi:hypothetical protein